MSNLINVNARLFRAAFNCVSSDKTRYYLHGVQIEAHPVAGVLLVATDGHRLVVIHDVSGSIEGPSRIVKLDKTMLAACKAARNETHDRRLQIVGGQASVLVSDSPVASSYDAIIDGEFPQWRRIAKPNLAEIGAGFYNPAYIKSFGDIADELLERKGAPVSIAGNSLEPALVRFDNVDYAYGVLMPVRGNVNVLEIPSAILHQPDADANQKETA